MPNYEYSCELCGTYEVCRPIADRDAPCICLYCAREIPRVMLNAPNISTISGQARAAHGINERSADSPKRLSSDGPLPAGVGVGRANSRTFGDGSKSFPASRPWMISR